MKPGVAKATTRNLGLILIVGASLSACNNKPESDVQQSEAPRGARDAQDQFGQEFGDAYRADPNSEPKNVSDAPPDAVSMTAEPVPID